MSDIDALTRRVAELEKEVATQKEEAKQREVTQLKWGVRALGLMVMAMGGWIWSQIGHIFDL
jgi:hypothetical protein